jgi:hypothetical protein
LNVLLSLAAVIPTPSHGPAPVVLEGDRFRVHVHFDAQELGARALEVVEATWDVAARLHGPAAPAKLLDVHLYPDALTYAAAEEQLTGGVFRQNLAFAHWNSKSAHVALQPPLSDEALAAVGLPYLTARFLSHEAAHLVRFAAMPNYRYHPTWFADGSATWVEVRVLEELGYLDSRVDDPMFCTDVGLVRRLVDHDRLPAVTDIFVGATDELGFYERYSVHWLLFELLAEHYARELDATSREIRGLDEGEGFAWRVREAIERAFGARLAELDAELRTYAGAIEPTWREHYRSLETAGDEWVHAAFERRTATALRTAPIGGDTLRLSGELSILPGGVGHMSVLLGYGEGGYVQVTFIADYGVHVLEIQGDGARTVTRQEVERMVYGQPFDFALRYATGVLALEVDGRALFEAELHIDLEGSWGLSAGAGSTGIWRNVALGR